MQRSGNAPGFRFARRYFLLARGSAPFWRQFQSQGGSLLKTIAIVVAALVIAYLLFTRWHNKWLAQQTPAGTWIAEDGDTRITLVFEEGPREGTYKQLTELNGNRLREFGHWAVSLHDLKMLIMATDISNHPRFGFDTSYRISYIGPDAIQIDGPDRRNMIYAKATEDAMIDFDNIANPQ